MLKNNPLEFFKTISYLILEEGIHGHNLASEKEYLAIQNPKQLADMSGVISEIF